jgi:hypothetical protein
MVGLINTNNMKAKFLKIAGVKSEKEFYKKYPTEAAFFKAHPEAKELKKAKIGSYIGGEQDVTPQHQSYKDYANLVPLGIFGKTQEEIQQEKEKKQMMEMQKAQLAAQGGGGGLGGLDISSLLGGLLGGGKGGGTINKVGGASTIGSFDAKAGAMSGAPKMATKTSYIPGRKNGGKVSSENTAKKGKKLKKAQEGAKEGNILIDSLASMDQTGLLGTITGGIEKIQNTEKRRKELEQQRKLSDLSRQASESIPERTARRYVRPEDAIVSPNERFVPGGTGTEILAEYGASIGGNPTEIQNMYNPGDLYSNLGYEPLSESDIVKQYKSGGHIPKAGFGSFMSGTGGQVVNQLGAAAFSESEGGSVGAEMGGAVGGTIGQIWGPAGQAIGTLLGTVTGGSIGAIADAPEARKEKRHKAALNKNIKDMAMQSSVRGALSPYSSHVKNGGNIPYAEYGWVSNDWQPQVIAKWGDVNVEDVDDIFRPADMRTLEHGGPVKAQGGYTLPYPNYEERVNRFRDIMSKYSEEELNRRATTEAGLAEYAKLYPNEPFTKEDISFFQDYTTKVLDPQTQAFMQRRGKEWTPGTVRSGTDAIWGPKTQKQPFANVLVQTSPGSEFKDVGIVREGYATSGTGASGASDMRGVPSKINIGGKQVEVDFRTGKPFFRNPSTGDMVPYDPSKYHADTGRYYRTGGNIRQNYLSELDNFNFGGSLKTHWGGKAEVDSYNPYLPGTGETVMFKGNQHSESDGKGNTGIGVSYGPKEHDSYTDYAEYGTEQAADVEVENGEPAIQLPDSGVESPMKSFALGGQQNANNLAMTVFGALKINKHAANEIGDKKAEGLTFKKFIAGLNKEENKANNKIAKANEQLEDLKVVTPFDRLKLNSLQSTIQGEDQKLKDYAVKKVTAAEVQNAYNETAEEYGLDADALTKGKIKQSKDMGSAKYGKEIEQAKKGKKKKKSSTNKLSALIKQPKLTDADFVTPQLIGTDYKPKEKSQLELLEEQGLGPKVTASQKRERDFDKAYDKLSESEKIKFNADVEAARKKAGEKKSKTDWLDFAKASSAQLANLLRRPLQEDLDPSQLIPEMLAKSQNQLVPVQAQTFQPLLDTPFDVSFQDQLNQNQATFNALQRQIGANPAALSALAAQKYSADKQVLADQFRTNQAMRAGVFSKNRDTLNDAALKNLAILDQQYVRQQEALSKTKATDLEIAKSISDKIAKNKLENRTFAAMSNMFPQYGFTRDMRAFSQTPTWFQRGIVGSMQDAEEKETKEKSTGKYGKNLKKQLKNGSIVKSLKNI